jgi:pyruvate/2-oxoglutarate dehydrogenase complex dihydrolipoamide dehydrogenase (E3) component
VIGEIWESGDLGIDIPSDTVNVEFSRVMERVRRVRAKISHHDSAERMRSLGIDVFFGAPKFRGRRSLDVDGKVLHFKKAVIASGSRPAHPPIPGLSDAGFLTNETVFSLTERPETLAVIGGGPLGCELAQAFNRLGSKVTIIERNAQFLPREDRDAAELISKVFEREGIRCLLKADVKKVNSNEGKKNIHLTTEGKDEEIEADEIIVGVGKIPNVEGLGLEAAGVDYDSQGIKTNVFLQTSNRHIYAAGDVCLDYKFTHMAEAAARIVIQNALFVKSKKVSSLIVPWCTYTEPEIAHVGVHEREAEEKGIPVDTFIQPFKDVDRAVLDGEEEGFVKVHVKKGKDKILGATVVARNAGEMINEITLAMVSGKGLKTLANVIHPYPTQGDSIKKLAGLYYVKKFSPFLQRVLRRWFAWKR